MDTLTWALLAGYPVLCGVIAYLFRALQASQEARLKQAEDHKQDLAEVRDAILRRTT